MSRGLLGVLPTCAAALALQPVELGAHGYGADPVMVKHRDDCRLAAQVLATGEPHTERDFARGYIANCENEWPPAIVQEWRTVPSDTAAAHASQYGDPGHAHL